MSFDLVEPPIFDSDLITHSQDMNDYLWQLYNALKQDRDDLSTGSQVFASLQLKNLTNNRLVSSNSSNFLVSTDLSSWLSGTTNEITITDDGDGTATASLPDVVYLGTAGKIGRNADNLIDFSTDNEITFRTNATDGVKIDSSGNLYIDSDSSKLYLGADQDLEIYHDGSNGYIDSKTGDLKLNSSAGGDISLWEFSDSGDNSRWLKFYSYLTAVGDKKYAQIGIQDTDDYFHLSREDSNILGFKVDMPQRIYPSSGTDYFEFESDSGLLKFYGTTEVVFDAPNASYTFADSFRRMLTFRGDRDIDQFLFGIDDDAGNQLILTNYNNISKDHDHPSETNPTLFIHSNTDPDTDNTQWLSLSHDKTNANIQSGKGNINLNNPITIADKTLLATPVAGTLEFDNDRMYVTNVATQRAIDRTSDVLTSTVTVANTTTETTIFTGSVPADSLKAENVIKPVISGVISNASAADICTIRVKLGGVTYATVASPGEALLSDCWHGSGHATIRTVGATGSIASFFDLNIKTTSVKSCSVTTIDTTTAENVTVTAQWNNAKSGNTISIYNGFIEYKN